jgi:hypothetical protein
LPKPDTIPLWLFLTEPGLAPLMVKELKFRDIVAAKARAFQPRLALHVMAGPVFGRNKISGRQLDLLAEAWRRERPDGLVASVAGKTFQRQDILRWLAKEMGARGIKTAVSAAPRRPAWLLAVDESYYIGLPRFNYHDSPGRTRDEDRSGSLPPVIAAALCFAARPGEGEVIWDPVMGTGTILREALALAPDAELIGSDTDEKAVEIARKALGKAPNVQLIAGDSTTVDLARRDLTLTLANLPFGKQFQPETGTAPLYEALLRRSLAFAAPNWRAVLLTSDHAALRHATEAVGGLSLEKLASIRTRGLAADIWMVRPSR